MYLLAVLEKILVQLSSQLEKIIRILWILKNLLSCTYHCKKDNKKKCVV